MRSDLISSGLIMHWLSRHAPHLVDGWNFQVTDELNGFLTRVLSVWSDMDAQMTSQGAIPTTAIELWNLRDIAMFGGGRPTPLTPRPDQILYYTDINPEVVEEVAGLGYNTRKVDVKQVDDLKQLNGASTAIATGLFHFLNDDAVHLVMRNFTEVGFRTVVFNNMNTEVSDELISNWTKLGMVLHRRSPEDMAALMPADWYFEAALDTEGFFAHHRELGPIFSQLTNLNYIYLAAHR